MRARNVIEAESAKDFLKRKGAQSPYANIVIDLVPLTVGTSVVTLRKNVPNKSYHWSEAVDVGTVTRVHNAGQPWRWVIKDVTKNYSLGRLAWDAPEYRKDWLIGYDTPEETAKVLMRKCMDYWREQGGCFPF